MSSSSPTYLSEGSSPTYLSEADGDAAASAVEEEAPAASQEGGFICGDAGSDDADLDVEGDAGSNDNEPAPAPRRRRGGPPIRSSGIMTLFLIVAYLHGWPANLRPELVPDGPPPGPAVDFPDQAYKLLRWQMASSRVWSGWSASISTVDGHRRRQGSSSWH